MNHFWKYVVQYELRVESIIHSDWKKWWPSQKQRITAKHPRTLFTTVSRGCFWSSCRLNHSTKIGWRLFSFMWLGQQSFKYRTDNKLGPSLSHTDHFIAWVLFSQWSSRKVQVVIWLVCFFFLNAHQVKRFLEVLTSQQISQQQVFFSPFRKQD